MAIELDDLKMTFESWMYLKDHCAIDVVLGCVIANTQLEGDPINLYLVAPPSSGKTEILRAVAEHPKVFSLSNLTPTTLISGHKSKDGKNHSLLLKLSNWGKEIIILKDFTTVLELRRESRQEILSQIREISDGYLSKSFGNDQDITWSGRLAIIAGVTPVIDRHHSLSQILGERFITYRMGSDDTRRMAVMAQKVAGKEKAMRRELGQMTKDFLQQFKKVKLEDIYISEPTREKLLSLSCFIAESELHHLVLALVVKERTGTQEEAEKLRVEIAEKLKERDRDKDAYLTQRKELHKELEKLTRPVISSFIQEFHREIEGLGKKKISEIISKRFDGFNSRTLLRVWTNQEAIQIAYKAALEAASKIQKIYLFSIPMIEAEGRMLLEAIRRVDLSRMSENEVDENNYFRGLSPHGSDPTFSGPRSGLIL